MRVLAAAAVCLALAACGGDDTPAPAGFEPKSADERELAGLVETFNRLQRAGDAEGICRQVFSPSFRRAAALAGGSCFELARGLRKDDSAAVLGVSVKGDRATLRLRQWRAGTETVGQVLAVRTHEGWRLTTEAAERGSG